MMAVFWDVAPCSQVNIDGRFIAVMMEAVNITEASVNLYETTWRNIPEDSHLHARRRENQKSRILE
jgi:hypothetical protein